MLADIYADLSLTFTGAQHCVHSLPRYPSSKPDQKTSIMPSLSERNFNSYSKQPIQLQTFNTPQDDIATMNVGYSTQPVHDNGYNKYPQNNFNPNQANGDHDRNGNTQIRTNGEYIHVSPSKQNYQCENSKESLHLCSTFRSPEHENPYSYHGFTAGHQGSGHSRKYNENYNGLPRSSRAGQSHQDGLNPSCHGQEMSPYSHSKYPSITSNYQALDPIPDDATTTTTTSGSYTIDPHELCTEIDELFFKNVKD